jgi:hypothetical protein
MPISMKRQNPSIFSSDRKADGENFQMGVPVPKLE